MPRCRVSSGRQLPRPSPVAPPGHGATRSDLLYLNRQSFLLHRENQLKIAPKITRRMRKDDHRARPGARRICSTEPTLLENLISDGVVLVHRARPMRCSEHDHACGPGVAGRATSEGGCGSQDFELETAQNSDGRDSQEWVCATRANDFSWADQHTAAPFAVWSAARAVPTTRRECA